MADAHTGKYSSATKYKGELIGADSNPDLDAQPIALKTSSGSTTPKIENLLPKHAFLKNGLQLRGCLH